MGLAGKNAARQLLKKPPRNLGAMGLDLNQLTSLIPSGATSAVNTAAQVAGYTQTPQFGQQVTKVTDDLEMYVYVQLGLQAVATAATFGIFLIGLHKFMRSR